MSRCVKSGLSLISAYSGAEGTELKIVKGIYPSVFTDLVLRENVGHSE